MTNGSLFSSLSLLAFFHVTLIENHSCEHGHQQHTVVVIVAASGSWLGGGRMPNTHAAAIKLVTTSQWDEKNRPFFV